MMDMRDAFFQGVYGRCKRDETVIVLAADHGAFILDKLAADMPKQFMNVGIAEQNMASVAAGFALSGRKPVIYAINNFLTLRALDQISQICNMCLPVLMVGVGAGYTYSTDGPTHHGVSDLGAMMALPNVEIFNCADEDASYFLGERDIIKPTYVRAEKGVFPRVTHTHGHAIKVLASGYLVHTAMAVGDDVGVINLGMVKPIDEIFLLNAVQGIHTLVVLEDNIDGPIASSVAKVLLKHGIHLRFKSMCPTQPLYQYGSREFVYKVAGLDVDSVRAAVYS